MNNNCISYWYLEGSDIFPDNLFGLYWLYRQIALDNELNHKEHIFIRTNPPNPQAKLFEFWISDALKTAVLFEDRVKVALCS